jgi:secreted trypsin-like serine protease
MPEKALTFCPGIVLNCQLLLTAHHLFKQNFCHNVKYTFIILLSVVLAESNKDTAIHQRQQKKLFLILKSLFQNG